MPNADGDTGVLTTGCVRSASALRRRASEDGRDGISEVAGIGVRPKYERRGIGGALTLRLTRAAHAAGASLVFLTPAGDAQERVYARVGYQRTDSVLFLSKETSA